MNTAANSGAALTLTPIQRYHFKSSTYVATIERCVCCYARCGRHSCVQPSYHLCWECEGSLAGTINVERTHKAYLLPETQLRKKCGLMAGDLIKEKKVRDMANRVFRDEPNLADKLHDAIIKTTEEKIVIERNWSIGHKDWRAILAALPRLTPINLPQFSESFELSS